MNPRWSDCSLAGQVYDLLNSVKYLVTMADNVKGSMNSPSDKIEISNDLFLQSMKQIMDENPRLFSKLAKL